MPAGFRTPGRLSRASSEAGAPRQRPPPAASRLGGGRPPSDAGSGVRLPAIHQSRSAPSLQAQAVARPGPPSVHSQGAASKASQASQRPSHEVRRKVLEALTHPEVKRLAEKFYEVELPNRSGRLGFKELRHALRSLNERLGLPAPSSQVAEQLFKRYDFNGDGSLNKDEFFELFVSSLRRFAFDRSTLLGREIFVSREAGKVWDNYDCLKKLGAGSFGAAYLTRHKRTGDERVVKAAGKSQVRLPVEDVEREIMVMMELDHPHVIRLYEWYEGTSSIYLVLDPLQGGTLQEVILENFKSQNRGIPEQWIRTVMRQATEAMAYCHSKRVIHKDLKDENVMLLKKDPEYQQPHIVIIDLGVSEMFGLSDPKGKMMAGTPTTMAPEVWTGAFGPKCDVWSLGCVLFELLSGDVPFVARSFNPQDWRALHKRGPNWNLLRGVDLARESCREMLTFDERSRPTMADCLAHKWYADKRKESVIIPAAQFGRLEKFCQESELKRAVMFEIASRLPMQHADRVVQFFKTIDKDGDGAISRQELANGFKAVGLKDSKMLERTFQALDIDGDGILSLHEFSAGVLMIFGDLLEERFRALFRKYDRDSSGFLDRSEAADFVAAASHVLARRGNRSPDDVAREVLRQCGETLSYEDAKRKLLVGIV